MARITTGIEAFDKYLATRGGTPSDATNASDIDRNVRAVTISRTTRHLERLAGLPALRRLVMRAPTDASLASIGGATGVEDLELYGGTMTSLTALGGLRKLRYLTISVASRLRTLEGLDGLTALQYLSVWHCAALTSIAPLQGLRRLRYVFLDGNMYKPMRLESLAPLAELGDLEVLKLHNVRVRDGDLTPLHGLHRLRLLDLPDHFAAPEVSALRAALPAAQGRWRSRNQGV